MVARAGLSNSSLGFDSDIKVDLPQSLNQLLVELEMHHMMMMIYKYDLLSKAFPAVYFADFIHYEIDSSSSFLF